jgi:hypothetical protein
MTCRDRPAPGSASGRGGLRSPAGLPGSPGLRRHRRRPCSPTFPTGAAQALERSEKPIRHAWGLVPSIPGIRICRALTSGNVESSICAPRLTPLTPGRGQIIGVPALREDPDGPCHPPIGRARRPFHSPSADPVVSFASTMGGGRPPDAKTARHLRGTSRGVAVRVHRVAAAPGWAGGAGARGVVGRKGCLPGCSAVLSARA